jgi:hypothetical protein
MAPVGGDVGAEGVEGAFNPIENVHTAQAKEFLLVSSEYNELGAGSWELGLQHLAPSS